MNRFSRPGPLAASTEHSPFFKLDLITRFLSGDSRVPFFFLFHRTVPSIVSWPFVVNSRRETGQPFRGRPVEKLERNSELPCPCASRVLARPVSLPGHWQTLKMSFRWTSIRVAPSRLLIYIIKSFEIVPLVFPEKIQLVCSMISST